jgi:hypothetical protein
LYHLLFLLRIIKQSHLPFNVPELWDAWQSFLTLGRKAVAILFQQVQLQYKNYAIAKSTLGAFIVQLRWSSTQIILLESMHNSVVLKGTAIMA